MIDKALEARIALTPRTGANLCLIDTFELPPDNIVLLGHYRTHADAAYEREHDYPEYRQEDMVIFDGSEDEPV